MSGSLETVLGGTWENPNVTPQKCPFQGDLDPLEFFGPTQVRSANSISIGSVIFAGLVVITERLTDNATHL